MDQEVICSFNAHYQKRVVREWLFRALDKNISLPKVLMLHATSILVSSWNVVFTETINNCFRKAGISSSSLELAQTDGSNPFKGKTRRSHVKGRLIQPESEM